MATVSNSLQATSNEDRKLLSVDDDMFTAYFDRHPFKISHDLVNHPLLQLPRLVELARSLDALFWYLEGDMEINRWMRMPPTDLANQNEPSPIVSFPVLHCRRP